MAKTDSQAARYFVIGVFDAAARKARDRRTLARAAGRKTARARGRELPEVGTHPPPKRVYTETLLVGVRPVTERKGDVSIDVQMFPLGWPARVKGGNRRPTPTQAFKRWLEGPSASYFRTANAVALYVIDMRTTIELIIEVGGE